VYGLPLIVAVTPEKLSSISITTHVLYTPLITIPEYVGGVLSIINVTPVVFQALSVTSNT